MHGMDLILILCGLGLIIDRTGPRSGRANRNLMFFSISPRPTRPDPSIRPKILAHARPVHDPVARGPIRWPDNPWPPAAAAAPRCPPPQLAAPCRPPAAPGRDRQGRALAAGASRKGVGRGGVGVGQFRWR
jgi:hypothetical protein